MADMNLSEFERMEARDWLQDCFGDSRRIQMAPDEALIRLLNIYYEGGLEAFKEACK